MRRSAKQRAGAADAGVDPAEAAKFAAMADDWWAPQGKFAPLHQLNPVRLRFIRDRVAARFSHDLAADRPLAGLRILDIGCGGGLLSEPLTRLGARVVGIDAVAEAVAVARRHAEESGLSIDYRHATAESMAASGEVFDAVLAMEVIEHVPDPAALVASAASVLAPGGILIVATLNRTPKAFLLAIVGAEYIMRWLPPGTHDWHKFLRPSELAAMAHKCGLVVEEIVGLSYSPLVGTWRTGGDLAVNYMLLAGKPGREATSRAV